MSWICLMYHDILPSTASKGGAAGRFAVPLDSFETMLDTIHATGHAGCSLEEAQRVAEPRVAISFDDGTRSQWVHAVPALRARSMTATFFVTTDWVGRAGFMTWGELRQMTAWGMSVQSHTKSHPFLSELEETAVLIELGESKETLDRELGQDTTQISLPGGDFPARALRHCIRSCGYTTIACSRWGWNPDPSPKDPDRALRRCTMRGELTNEGARRILSHDAWLSVSMSVKEIGLNSIRRALGATRYAKWRRRFLDSL